MIYLQDTEMEFALSIWTCFRALIGRCLGDNLQRVSSHRVVRSEQEVVPIDDDGKVVPVIFGEWGREQHVQTVIQDFHVVCVGGRKIARRIGER